MRFAGFIGPSYVARSKNFDCQRTINWYPELNEIGTGREREVACLAQVPGKRVLLDFGGSYKNRGSLTAADGKLYAVNGNKLYYITSAWTATELGTLESTEGPVSIAENGKQLCVVDGDHGYVYTYHKTGPQDAAALTIQDITYTAVDAGVGGNDITIEYVDVTPGIPNIEVSGKAITVNIQSGSTTAIGIVHMIEDDPDASALVTAVADPAHESDAQVAASAQNLSGGTDWDEATFELITDEDFPGATQVVFQDGYFIFTRPDSQQFFICDLYDATSFDALDFASSEANPDNIVGCVSDHRDLWMFNSQSVEVFYNSGNADFPFERNQGAFIETGCAAAFSIQKMNNTVYWVGRDKDGVGQVYQAQGYQPKRISTHPIDRAIASYGDISDTTSWTYQMSGHFFYCLNFKKAKTTWVYDASTGLWHERVKTKNGLFEKDRVLCHSLAYAKHVVFDSENGKVYELTDEVYDDAGEVLTRRRISPHISNNGVMNFHSEIQLDIETGVGLDGAGQGTDPVAVLRFSDDYGKSWSNERWEKIGKIGETKKRVSFRRLGRAVDRVYEVTVTDPVRATLLGADIKFQPGAA